MQVNLAEVTYAGFWARLFATILDTIIQALVLVPLLYLLYGREMFVSPALDSDLAGVFVQYIFPLLWVILFWKYKSATPGKMMMGMAIVDATTGANPTTTRLVMRYLGYIISAIPCLLGFFYIAWDKRKQGFHDMIANTVVIMTAPEARHVNF